MAKKGRYTHTGEWAKHLRRYGKQLFWSKERMGVKTHIHKIIKEIY